VEAGGKSSEATPAFREHKAEPAAEAAQQQDEEARPYTKSEARRVM
jgi:hypothetical protein